jgi:methionyl aminopeptidase
VIVIKSESEQESMRTACRMAADVMQKLCTRVHMGITTRELDTYAERLIREQGAEPAFKGYRGYPATLCTSVNNGIIHGIPNGRRVENGDILSIDVGIRYKGFFGDLAVTLPIGEIAAEASSLLDVTREALNRAIAVARPGKRLYDISYTIQSYVESHGMSVVREFVGHGIGRNLHEEPQIPNYGPPNQGPRLKPGMIFCLEPMVNLGGSGVRILEDGWTAVTADGSLSAHFEHAVLVTESEPEVLTLPSGA